MSKAEDLSNQYMDFRKQCGIKDPVMLNEIGEAYYEGYLQAEKDMELGWEDIEAIDSLIDDVSLEETDTIEDLYQEVLKRFNKERKEK